MKEKNKHESFKAYLYIFTILVTAFIVMTSIYCLINEYAILRIINKTNQTVTLVVNNQKVKVEAFKEKAIMRNETITVKLIAGERTYLIRIPQSNTLEIVFVNNTVVFNFNPPLKLEKH